MAVANYATMESDAEELNDSKLKVCEHAHPE
jgi:hypothetical protein